jgi:hypothetical protein
MGTEPWIAAAIANAVVAICLLAFGAIILRGMLAHSNKIALPFFAAMQRNPLAALTAALFAAGGMAHLVHFALVVGAAGDAAATAVARAHGSAWPVWVGEVLLASVALAYATQTRRLEALTHGAAIYEDVQRRRAHALDLHDNVVQSLSEAKLALELGRSEQGLAALEESLHRSRAIITDLLGSEDSSAALAAGRLRRKVGEGDV